MLTIQFASLISSLINIISLDVTSFNSAMTLKLKCGSVDCVEFLIFGGSLLGRIQCDREPVSLFSRFLTEKKNGYKNSCKKCTESTYAPG